MPLDSGQKIGPYEIVAPIGAGGMGEVYRARDSKLKREVAIKVLPAEVATDHERLARFRREAEVLASLNHPHIAHVYDFEEAGPPILVMELVDGEDLSQRIAQGPIPIDDALAIARQIAEALQAAHDAGIIHRDLKPANVKVRQDGTVKVLDFGLAKGTDPTGSAHNIANSPTITSPAMTMHGVILGTAAYMSPEQAKGAVVDKRSDVWSFGCVLFEMLAGKRAFSGDDLSEVMAAVIRTDIDWSALPADTTPATRTLLRLCLLKDRSKRAANMGVVRLLLDPPPELIAANRPSGSTRRWLWAAAIAAATVIAVAGITSMRPSTGGNSTPLTRFRVRLPDNVTWTPSGVLSVSPDGSRVVFAAIDAAGRRQLWLRELGQLEARPLPRTDIENPTAPFWSPDSRSIAFWADRKLKRIDLRNETVDVVCESPSEVLGGSWTRDDQLLFGTADGVMMVPLAGGAPVAVTKVESREVAAHQHPIILPDGKHFLYFHRHTDFAKSTVRVGEIGVAPEAQSKADLLKTGRSVIYAAGESPRIGHVLYIQDDVLMARRFDATTESWAGEPRAVIQHAGGGQFAPRASVSPAGVLVYAEVPDRMSELTWFDRAGRVVGKVGEPALYGVVALSPDNTRIAAVITDSISGNDDIWLINAATGQRTRFTVNPAAEGQPTWSPDGQQLAFRSNRGSTWGIYRKSADGSGDETLVESESDMPNPTHWSPDGRYLVWYTFQRDVLALPMTGSGPRVSERVLATPNSESAGRVSPDSKWLAYISNESGIDELYARPFRTGPGDKFVISTGGSPGVARWRRDGKELTYLARDGVMMSVPISLTPSFQHEAPRPLFRLPLGFMRATTTPGARIDATSNNERYLVSMPTAQGALQEFTVVMNWQALLEQ